MPSGHAAARPSEWNALNKTVCACNRKLDHLKCRSNSSSCCYRTGMRSMMSPTMNSTLIPLCSRALCRSRSSSNHHHYRLQDATSGTVNDSFCTQRPQHRPAVGAMSGGCQSTARCVDCRAVVCCKATVCVAAAATHPGSESPAVDRRCDITVVLRRNSMALKLMGWYISVQ